MDKLIHKWEVNDEHGFRTVELWLTLTHRTAKHYVLFLVAYNKDGNEVAPNV